ncbi:helix-turn-helix transcriptional regulator [Treponema sp.]|uniref:helix-turn-helix domain-containing protein n=1 Tax=Treponema sp. TaxID=166 RepID=UPI00298DD6E5|nr:helix-turn-helix transcriptional regulator [Treponema sp.]
MTPGYVDYDKLWKLVKSKGIKNKTELIPMANISTNVLAKLNKGEFISMDSMQKICIALNCDVGDICVMNDVQKDPEQEIAEK